MINTTTVNKFLDIKNANSTIYSFNKVFFLQTGLSSNLSILSVLYSGGVMMSDAKISVGDLTSFMLYAAFVGISFRGEENQKFLKMQQPNTVNNIINPSQFLELFFFLNRKFKYISLPKSQVNFILLTFRVCSHFI